MKDKEPHICCHDQVYRREVLKYALGFGGALIGRSLLNRLALADSPSNPIDPLTAAVSEEISYLNVELTRLGLDDPLGRIITKAKIDSEDRLRVTYEKLDLVKDDLWRPSHRLKLLSERGYDLYMDYGGVQGASRIPLPQAEPVDIPSYISDILLGMGNIFGREYYLTGAGEYGLYKTYRVADDEGDTFALQEMLDGPKAGTITLATIAPYFFDAGLIPQDDVLSVAQEPTPKPEVQPTPTTIIFPRYPQIPLPTPDPSYTKRPIIRGDAECIFGINAALDFAKDKAPLEYNLIITNFGVIECTDKSFASGYFTESPPRATVGKVFLQQPRSSLSSVLVHESCHSWQVQRFRELYPANWMQIGRLQDSGAMDEAECYTIEYYYLKKLGATESDLKALADWVFNNIGIRIPLQ